jgi:competence protein ComEC
VTLDGVVVAEPDVRDTSTRLTVAVQNLFVGHSARAVDARVLVVADAFTHVAYGDRIRVKGVLQLPEAIDGEDGRTFNYPAYLAKDGIGYEMKSLNMSTRERGKGNAYIAAIIAVKHLYMQGTTAVLPEPEAGLSTGITVGDKRSIGSTLSDEFKRAGLVHVLVLSGYNITIVMNAAAYLLARAPPILNASAQVLLAITFVIIGGGGASALRAALMAILAVVAHRSHRQYLPTRILGVVCAGMVAWNPFILMFDPSFELSALATLGLLMVSPIVEHYLSRVTEQWSMRETLATTIGTQIMTMPFILYENGLLSLIALPANILVLSVIPPAMFLSCVAAVCGCFFGTLAVPIAFPAYALLWYVLWITHLCTSIPFASVTVGAFNVWWMVAAYVVVGIWVALKNRE